MQTVIRPVRGTNLSSIYIKIKAGLSSEGEYAGTGITHFIEHMIFKGSPETGIGKLARSIKSFGGYINATTSLDTTTFYVILPSEHVEEALKVLTESVFNPVFDAEEVEKEREVILNEIRLHRDEPESRLSEILFMSAYSTHPYKAPLIGYEDLFKKLKIEDLKNYHKRFYIPNNAVVVITGDIEKEKNLSKIKELYDKFPRCQDNDIINIPEPPQLSKRTVVEKMDVNLGYFVIGFHSTGMQNPDIYALDILAAILGQRDESRLRKALVKNTQMLFSVESYNYTPLYPGLFIVSGIGSPDKLEEAVKIIYQEIDHVKTGDITDEELVTTKNSALAMYYNTIESVGALAGDLAENQMFFKDADFSRKYVDDIAKITKEDIKRVAKKYLTENNSTVVYLMPRQQTDAVDNSDDENKLIDKDFSEKKIVLDNGIRVILKEDHRIPIVNISLMCLGGLKSEPKELNGIADLTSMMLLKGTTTKKESEIKSGLQELGGNINTFSGANSFGVSVECFSKDLKYSLGMLKDVIENSIFPSDELDKLKKQVKSKIAIDDNNNFSQGMLYLKRGIYKDHPYANRSTGEIDSINRITVDNVKEFYAKVLNSENIVISCVGDFDSDEILSIIKNDFSNIKANKFKITNMNVKPLDGAQEKNITLPKEEAVFFIGFNGVNINNPDKYKLDVLFKIMSGMDGKLFNSIRDAFGLSYTQGGASSIGIDDGICFFYVATAPKDLGRASNILCDLVKKLSVEPVTDVELSNAKNALLGQHMMSLEKNEQKAMVMGMDELYGLGYDNYKTYKENVIKCTKDDIMEIAKRYLNLDKSYVVKVSPKET